MEIKHSVAIVTGGASGLGEATVRRIVAQGGKAVILDLKEESGFGLVKELGDQALFIQSDVADEKSLLDAVNKTIDVLGAVHILVNCAGIAPAQKVLGRKGPHPLEDFNRVLQINLIGTFNAIRLVAGKMLENAPNGDGERGVVINTASIAAYEGQIGQAAYSASKAAIVGMTLPIAREFANDGIRVVSIAPGLFNTPMFQGLPQGARDSLGKIVPFPNRLGKVEEYAQLAETIIHNVMLNGTTIRLDGAVRMQPK